jgi:hypothetical protein
VYLEEVKDSATTTIVRPTASWFLTGVGAPTTTANAWVTGVGAPTGNATRTGVMPVFTGAANLVGVKDTLVGLALGAIAAFI